jgi:hypothetical protein
MTTELGAVLKDWKRGKMRYMQLQMEAGPESRTGSNSETQSMCIYLPALCKDRGLPPKFA